MRFLPILIPCLEPKSDGTANGKHVQVVSFEVVDLLIDKRSAFHEKYGDFDEAEEKWLRGYWHLNDAVRTRKRRKLQRVVLELAQLADEQNVKIPDDIAKDPLAFVHERLGERVGAALLVLWRTRSSDVLNAGIYCEGGMLDALYALMLFRIGVGDSGGTSSCDICGATFERSRGDRRKTCSDKCRKRASRIKGKPAAATTVT